MWRVFVIFCSLAIGTQAFAPAPIWRGARGRRFVLAPSAWPDRVLTPPQDLALWDHMSVVASDVCPHFTARIDKSIIWDAKGLCLEVGGKEVGTVVRVNHCNGGPAQKWNWVPSGRGHEMIQLQGTNKCIDVFDINGDLNGAPVGLRECDDRLTESWKFEELIPVSGRGHSQRLRTFALRRVRVRIFPIVAFGALSLGAWLWWRNRGSMVSMCQSRIPLNVDQAAVSIIVPSAPRRGGVCLMSARDASTVISEKSGVESRFWQWRGQQIRYTAMGLENTDGPCVLLVHGLFVNADHWRQNLPALAAAGFRAYAIDLLGYGYSSKPPPCSEEARAISGENNRTEVMNGPLSGIELGTPSGGVRMCDKLELAHPLGSVYNFYTWAEQLVAFTEEVIKTPRATLVANSIGTISALQAVKDRQDLFDGVFVVNPNFRELHTAESSAFIQPVVRFVQGLLRRNGQPLFDALAKPETVKQILKEPYADAETVTDDLVDVLLTPLLAKGSADVVFDTLSYSAGPLPEQLLQDRTLSHIPVVVCWGDKDPWTPGPRVEGLRRYKPVEKVIKLPGIGHCPHDEAPDLVNPLLVDFVNDVSKRVQVPA